MYLKLLKGLHIFSNRVSIKKSLFVFSILTMLFLLAPLSSTASFKSTVDGTINGNVGDIATYEMTEYQQVAKFNAPVQLANGTSFHYNYTQGMKFIYKLDTINVSETGYKSILFKESMVFPDMGTFDMPETASVGVCNYEADLYVMCGNYFSYSFPDNQSALTWYSANYACAKSSTINHCYNNTDNTGKHQYYHFINSSFVNIAYNSSGFNYAAYSYVDWVFNWKTGWAQSFYINMAGASGRPYLVQRVELVDFHKGPPSGTASGKLSTSNFNSALLSSYGVSSPGLTVFSVLPSLAILVTLVLIKRKRI